MKKNFAIALLVFFAFYGCVNNQKTQEQQDSVTVVDSLLDEVVAGHDVVMPKMPKLERLQKECIAAKDSLGKLSAAMQQSSAINKVQLDSVITKLGDAETAMNKWMNEFNYDSFKNNEAERVKYLQGEKEKVIKMKDVVLNSISAAESILNKK